jgi:hypothetical protein
MTAADPCSQRQKIACQPGPSTYVIKVRPDGSFPNCHHRTARPWRRPPGRSRSFGNRGCGRPFRCRATKSPGGRPSSVNSGVAIRDFDMPPAFERREDHEEIGRAVALVFIIEPDRPSLFHLDRSACFGKQLLRGLVQANQRNIGIARPRIHGQHVLHGGHECAVGFRRNDQLLFQMGLKDVFLRVRPIVLSLARSTMFSSTTLFSNNRNVQRARPLGGSEQARRSAWLPSRHRKFWQRQAWRAAFGSAPPRSPLPPAVCAPGRPWMGWSPAPRPSIVIIYIDGDGSAAAQATLIDRQRMGSICIPPATRRGASRSHQQSIASHPSRRVETSPWPTSGRRPRKQTLFH